MKKIIISFILLIVLTLVACGNVDESDNAVDEYDAQIMAEKFVEDRLTAPSTAEFPSIDEILVSGSGNRWSVQGYVDAENGFGAKIRTRYGLEMTYDPDTETWNLENILFD